MNLLLLPLLAALPASDSLPRPTAPTSAPAAAVVVHRQPAIPLVAVRMAVLADDPPGYAGAGHLVQHLVEPSLREQVALVGGQVQLQRTSDAVVFTVIGPARELDFLAGVLRSALRPPPAGEAALLRASRELAEERLAEWETAERHARSVVRARLFPTDLSAAGTETAANRLMEGDAVRTAWSELYRPERVTVTAVGDVALEDVERAFADLPAAPPGRSAQQLSDTLDLSPLAPAEATQAWLALGYPASELEPAALSVASRVLGDQIRTQVSSGTADSEHWWTHHGQALVVLVSVPGPEMAATQRMLATALTRAETTLTGAQVFQAAKALRREMLFYARTPDRMAEVLGQFTDRGGDADAAQKYYAELERVSEQEVRRALRALAARTPIRVEIPPQKLIRR